jgi:hypothetical protein
MWQLPLRPEGMMRLAKVFVRFYKSFNFDYERRFFGNVTEADPWDLIEGAWYPFVGVDLEPSITTVVGSNEAGKSHLLDAIQKLIEGTKLSRSDFCRYSRFFSVEEGKVRLPDLGGQFEIQTDAEAAGLNELMDLKDAAGLVAGDSFRLFRLDGGEPQIYVREERTGVTLTREEAVKLPALLPAVFRLEPDLPLPESIPLADLNPAARRAWGTRPSRGSILEKIFGQDWEPQSWTQSFGEFVPLLGRGPSVSDTSPSNTGSVATSSSRSPTSTRTPSGSSTRRSPTRTKASSTVLSKRSTRPWPCT